MAGGSTNTPEFLEPHPRIDILTMITGIIVFIIIKNIDFFICEISEGGSSVFDRNPSEKAPRFNIKDIRVKH